jgi:hypothetical protein
MPAKHVRNHIVAGPVKRLECLHATTGGFLQRTDSIRAEVQRLIRQVPFRRFVLSLENGERALIEHPENIAFEPAPDSSDEFYVISGKLRLFSTFGAVTGVILADRDGAIA